MPKLPDPIDCQSRAQRPRAFWAACERPGDSEIMVDLPQVDLTRILGENVLAGEG